MNMVQLHLLFVAKPTRNDIDIIKDTAERGLTIFKNLTGEITIETTELPKIGWRAILTVPEQDKSFWLGYIAGVRLGINIGVRITK